MKQTDDRSLEPCLQKPVADLKRIRQTSNRTLNTSEIKSARNMKMKRHMKMKRKIENQRYKREKRGPRSNIHTKINHNPFVVHNKNMRLNLSK